MSIIKPRTRGKHLMEHRTRLDRGDRGNHETLYAYATFGRDAELQRASRIRADVLGGGVKIATEPVDSREDRRALPETVGEERTESRRSVCKNVGGVVPGGTNRATGWVFRCEIDTGLNPKPTALWLV